MLSPSPGLGFLHAALTCLQSTDKLHPTDTTPPVL